MGKACKRGEEERMLLRSAKSDRVETTNADIVNAETMPIHSTGIKKNKLCRDAAQT